MCPSTACGGTQVYETGRFATSLKSPAGLASTLASFHSASPFSPAMMVSSSQILASRLVVVRVGSAGAGEVVQVRGEGQAEDEADDPEVGHLSLR